MRTYKSCAESYDSPEYWIRKKSTLLHQDAKNYFLSEDRHNYKLPETKPIKTINKNAKFGLSRDSPYITPTAFINYSTKSLYGSDHNDSNNNDPNKHFRELYIPPKPHTAMTEAMRKSKGDFKQFAKLLHCRTDTRPHKATTKVFIKFLNMSASKDTMVSQSLMNPWNRDSIRASTAKSAAVRSKTLFTSSPSNSNNSPDNFTHYSQKVQDFLKIARISVSSASRRKCMDKFDVVPRPFSVSLAKSN